MALTDLYDKPGYQFRRMRQIAAALFAEESAPFGVTAQQWTTLKGLAEFTHLEQNELCEVLCLDRATMATLLARLEEKELVHRKTSTSDRRRKHVAITPRGRRVLTLMEPIVARIQDRLLEPLAPAERRAFSRMLTTLVDAHTATAGKTAQEEAS